jgi:hypothetical protein
MTQNAVPYCNFIRTCEQFLVETKGKLLVYKISSPVITYRTAALHYCHLPVFSG